MTPQEIGRTRRAVGAASVLLLLGACASKPIATVAAAGGIQLQPVAPDAQVPEYAKKPYEPFSRENAIAVALREWRAWGMLVNDAAPGPDLPVPARSDRQAGMWQRVGDYWWFGQNALSQSSGWTGKYGDYGTPYGGAPPAWSAAFISYLMRVAGAGDRFPYSPLHATYINAAATGNAVLQAQPPEVYPPQPGDLICYGRRGAERLRLADLPAPSFYGHCDMVAGVSPGQLTVIGGNVSAGVTLKHVPITGAGMIAGTDGTPVDRRYPWFVVLQVKYDRSDISAVLPVPLPYAASPMPMVDAPAFEAAPVEPVAEPPPRAPAPAKRAPRRLLRGRY